MTPADQALRDAFLAELWPVCKEVSREDRDVKRALDEAFRNPLPVDRDSHKSTGHESRRSRGYDAA